MNSTNTLDPKDILTPEELAKRLKVGVGWVYEKSRVRGKYCGTPLPCLRMGRYLRFAWPDVIEWMRDAPAPQAREYRRRRKKPDCTAATPKRRARAEGRPL